MANTVWGLSEAGFDAHGVDYAQDTVAAINRIAPELQVIQADVRDLPYADDHFDAVWSLGVIEHFPEGYDAILSEMKRVLKPGGLAFVTVPSMSPLRRLKAKVHSYQNFDGDFTNFYQFILSPRDIVQKFEAGGWALVKSAPRGGFKGLKDEAGPLYGVLQKISALKSAPVRLTLAALNRLLAPVTYHTRLYIFQA